MHRSTRARRRSRSDGRSSYLVGLVVYGGLLVLVDIRPGWEVLPFLTPAAKPMFGLVSLALIVSLVAQAAYVIDDSPRLRAGVAYLVSLLGIAAVALAWTDFPFTFDFLGDGQVDDGWSTFVRLVLGGLFAWFVYRAVRMSFRIVQGRRAPRLAERRTMSTI